MWNLSSYPGPNSRGFLLLEIMVSLAVIGGSLIFITRSYGISKRLIMNSERLFEVCRLSENKLVELESRGPLESGSDEGRFEENNSYRWHISSVPIEETKLISVSLNVFPENDPEASYEFATYFKNKSAEESPT